MANLEPFAESYAKRGWKVFPVHGVEADGRCTCGKPVGECKPGKHPATKNGFKNATSDPDKVKKLWKRENYNIGFSTEHGTAWVLDLDGGGDKTLAELVAKHGPLPRTPTQLTPRGGRHYIFAPPADGLPVPRRIGFLPGLDALGEAEPGTGGYAILAPSETDLGAYRWEISPDDCPPAQAPQWLLDYVRNAEKARPRPAFTPMAPITTGSTSAYGRGALDKLCNELAGTPPGQQEVTLSKIAVRVGSLAGGGNIDWQEAQSAVVAAAMAMPNGDPQRPWRLDEVQRKVDQAMHKGAADPTPPPAPTPRLRLIVTDRQEVTKHDPKTGEIIEAAPKVKKTENSDGDNKERPKSWLDELPFRVLGYNHENYYYMPHGKGQMTTLKPRDHTVNNLLQLADLATWAKIIGAEDKITSQQWTEIVNALMQQCHQAGVFNEESVRGRGAWVDDGRVIVHTGKSARIGGEDVPLRKVVSQYVYDLAPTWDFKFATAAATGEQAHKLVEICGRITWAEDISAAMLTGWCVIAPICGALPWRPHIWLTGPGGAGKSTVLNEIVGRVVGPAAEHFDGTSTEAAIRQTLGFDARPALLDEAETEDQKSAERMEGVLRLARIASSGGVVRKGSSGHKAVSFVIRSCFLFSSINTALRHYADESRITRLVLRKNINPDAEQHYKDLMRDINDWFTPDYASAMFARTIANLPALLENIRVFTAAAAAVFGSRRAADQLGAMLAGYSLCHSTKVYTFAAATKFIQSHDWERHLALDGLTDEMKLFQHLVSHRLKLTLAGSSRDVSIGQAINNALDREVPVLALEYQNALGSRGVRVDLDTVTVSNTSPAIRAMLHNTPWVNDWKGPLSAIPGATRTPSAVWFAPGLISRGIVLPLSLLNE